MFQKGDIIEGKWRVESNHCGLPWPVDVAGNHYCGCVYVSPVGDNFSGTGQMLDAMSGLEIKNMGERVNNLEFDYDNRIKRT